MLLLIIGILLLLQTTIGAPIATSILTAIAGLLAPIITGFLKRATAATGGWAAFLTALVCAGLALLVGFVAFYTGEIKTWIDVVKLAPWIFTEATLLYHLGLPTPSPSPSKT